jgi:3-dehydroquinate dehydratase/shikimate dehydrogenase
MLAQAALAAGGGADLLEYRLDYLRQRPATRELAAIVNRSPLPVIFTYRPKDQGGRFEGDRKARLEVLVDAAAAGGAYVDIEMDCLNAMWSIAKGRANGGGLDMDSLARRIIVSHHYFSGRPAGLGSILKAMEAMPSCVSKIAFAGSSWADAAAALDTLRGARRPGIVIAMGEAGLASRVLAKKFGAFGTFAALEAATGTAPGQPTLADMHNLYRWSSIGPATKVYGVVGCPIAHSMSPAVHNAAMAAAGVDGVYMPLRVEPGEQNFRALMKSLADNEWLDFAGLSVTIPHKENALAFLGPGNCDEAAVRIGAVNTITWHGRPARVFVPADEAMELGGKMSTQRHPMGGTPMPRELMGGAPVPRGHNTDHVAAREALCHAMAIEPEGLRGLKVAILGGGGAARAVAYGLLAHGASVTIYNRTLARGQALARELGCQAAGMEEVGASDASIIVNCTSVGMHPKVEKSPLDAIPPSAKVVFDTVYNPPQTLLLKMAAQAGCVTVGGAEMFLRQAQRQFVIFTGLPAPADVMRDAFMSCLKG